MRIVASVQAKRGSSRGLVHYIAHSKLDVERESEKGRELFNSYADSLSVESANNSIKMGIDRARPSNDELHHLVLSFRPDDYERLGRDEKARRRGLKEVTRAAMLRLENHLGADRLSWAAAVHLNTENPHVHIALQKEYFTTEIERKFLAKVPREALPHYETRRGEKVPVPGFLIEGAMERMEQLMDRDRDHLPERHNDEKRSVSVPIFSNGMEQRTDGEVPRSLADERDILRRGFLAEYELRRIESKITELIENGRNLRFLVLDPESGRRTRLSLRDLEKRRAISDIDPKTPAETQIRTILFKMLAKEETAKTKHQSETKDTIREASRIKELYRRNDWKLPVPSFTKDELDTLQEHYIQASDLRKFSYLEGVRSELEGSGEIGPRDERAFGRIAAKKTIADLHRKIHQTICLDFAERSYYHRVEIGEKRLSLAQLDRDENGATNPSLSLVEKVRETALRLSGNARGSGVESEPENERLRNDTLSKLGDHSAAIKRGLRNQHKTVKLLEKILATGTESPSSEVLYTVEELAEIDALSLRLKLRTVYEENRERQRALIEAAGNDSRAYRKVLKADPSADFRERKRSVIAGRALAREIVAKVELHKAKEDLETFTESKRFHKFAIHDKKTDTAIFLSLHDVDLPRRGSILDRAVNELFEGREHRRLRRSITSLVTAREQRLKDDLDAAKGILASASRDAAEFTRVSFFGLRSEPVYRPIFTSSEITTIEIRASKTPNEREAAHLRSVLESTADQPSRSLTEILRDFEEPSPTRAADRERDPAMQETSDRIDMAVGEHKEHASDHDEKIKEPQIYGPSRWSP